MVSNDKAFAALREDGSVVAWGDFIGGGDTTNVSDALDGSTKVITILSTSTAFSAVREDGSIISWGDSNRGADTSLINDKLDSVAAISTISPNSSPVLESPSEISIAGSVETVSSILGRYSECFGFRR